jgi:hypothetical protein
MVAIAAEDDAGESASRIGRVVKADGAVRVAYDGGLDLG